MHVLQNLVQSGSALMPSLSPQPESPRRESGLSAFSSGSARTEQSRRGLRHVPSAHDGASMRSGSGQSSAMRNSVKPSMFGGRMMPDLSEVEFMPYRTGKLMEIFLVSEMAH